jgi:hypothetical protein
MGKRPAELDDVDRQPHFQQIMELATTGNIFTRVPSCAHFWVLAGNDVSGGEVCTKCGARQSFD